jgi:hypothetical protein
MDQQQPLPLVSILCPPPVNVVICSNTFVKFRHGSQEVLGLVVAVLPLTLAVSIRLFLSWDDVKERIGANHLPPNISFWPKDNLHPPFYLCDTDIVVNDVPTSNIVGLAFVFHDTNPCIRLITGMKNTYRVTSCVWLSLNVITHGLTFVPFPSERFPAILKSCFPSMIFTQLVGIKRSLQRILNTRSLSSKNYSVTQIENIDYYTWLYLVRDAPIVIETSSVVSRAGDVVIDEFIQRSWREEQLSFWIGDENQLAHAQALFGINIGVGVRFTVSCRLGRNTSYAEASREIAPTDTLNIVPFENESIELVRRGVQFKYKTASKVLTLTVRYRRVIGRSNFHAHLEARGMVRITNEDEVNIYPLHHDVLVDGCNVEQYNFSCNTVRLSDNRHLRIDNIINLIDRDLF